MVKRGAVICFTLSLVFAVARVAHSAPAAPTSKGQNLPSSNSPSGYSLPQSPIEIPLKPTQQQESPNSIIIKIKAPASPSKAGQYSSLTDRLARWKLDEKKTKSVFQFGKPLSFSNIEGSLSSSKGKVVLSQAALARATQKGRQPKYDKVPELGTIYVIELDGQDASAVAGDLSQDENIIFAQPNNLYSVSQLGPPTNDEFVSEQWALSSISAPSAWSLSLGENVIVAVVDTGVRIEHEDLIKNIHNFPNETPGNCVDDDGNGFIDDVNGYDFSSTPANWRSCPGGGTFSGVRDGYGHGTHVAGIIAAEANNRVGIAGIAPRARILPVKGLSDTGMGSAVSLANALLYAAQNGADVINNSWGFAGSDPLIEDAILAAHSLGATLVFANGNNGAEISGKTWLRFGKTINVAASDQNDLLAYFSTRGILTSVAAPGASIISTFSRDSSEFPGYDYTVMSGTSMAAPCVSAVAALVLSANPSLTNDQVHAIIRESATDLGVPGIDPVFGSGKVNALRAVEIAIRYAQDQIREIPFVHLSSPRYKSLFSGSDSTPFLFFKGEVNGAASDALLFELSVRYKTPENSPWRPLASGAGVPSSGVLATLTFDSLNPGTYIAKVTVSSDSANTRSTAATEFSIDRPGVHELPVSFPTEAYRSPIVKLSGSTLAWGELSYNPLRAQIVQSDLNTLATSSTTLPGAPYISDFIRDGENLFYISTGYPIWPSEPSAAGLGLHRLNTRTGDDTIIEPGVRTIDGMITFYFMKSLSGSAQRFVWFLDGQARELRYFDGVNPPRTLLKGDLYSLANTRLAGDYVFVAQKTSTGDRILKIDPTSGVSRIVKEVLPSCNFPFPVFTLSNVVGDKLAISELICQGGWIEGQTVRLYDVKSESWTELFTDSVLSFYLLENHLLYLTASTGTLVDKFVSYNLGTGNRETLTYSQEPKRSITGSGPYAAWVEYMIDKSSHSIRLLKLDGGATGDLVPPVTTISGVDGLWHKNAVTFTLHAEDTGSGVRETFYSVDGAPFASYQGPITIDQEGVHKVSYYSTDNRGNQEQATESSQSIKIDRTPPQLSVSINQGAPTTFDRDLELNLTISDASGMGDGSKIELSFDGITWEPAMPLNSSRYFVTHPDPAPGIKFVFVRVQDPIGNWSLTSSDSIQYVLPDLEVIDFGVASPELPVGPDRAFSANVGDPIVFKATVKNVGTLEMPPIFELPFNVDGFQVTIVYPEKGLAPGESRTFIASEPWTAPEGQFSISAAVDPRNPLEVNPDNNQLGGTLTVVQAHPPTVSNPGPQRFYADNFSWFKLQTSDPDGDPVTLTMENAPLGAKLNLYGEFIWTPKSTQVGTYTVRFVARDTPRAGRSSTTTVEVPITVLPPKTVAPLAPSNLVVRQQVDSLDSTKRQATVTWLDRSDNEDGFYHQVAKSGSGPFSTIYKVYPNITQSTQSGLLAGTSYYYRICAFNKYGTSCSAPVGFKTSANLKLAAAAAPLP